MTLLRQFKKDVTAIALVASSRSTVPLKTVLEATQPPSRSQHSTGRGHKCGAHPRLSWQASVSQRRHQQIRAQRRSRARRVPCLSRFQRTVGSVGMRTHPVASNAKVPVAQPHGLLRCQYRLIPMAVVDLHDARLRSSKHEAMKPRKCRSRCGRLSRWRVKPRKGEGGGGRQRGPK